MAARYFFYRGQQIAYTDLNSAFDGLEAADHAFALDAIFTGISIGGGIAQAVSPNLSVVLSGPTVAYDQLGQRIYVAANTPIDCSKDYLGVSTAVVTNGNKKILSIFLVFARVLSNPQTTTDTPPQTIQYNQAEGFQILVYQGAEGATPSPPPLLSNGILLADITLSNTGGVSQTQIHTDGVGSGGSHGFYPANVAGHDVAQKGVGDTTNAAYARSQILFSIAHGATWPGINATSILGALTAISAQIDAIGTAGGLAGYLGSNLTPNITGSWADSTNLAPEITMGDAISDIVRHLGSTASGSNGARLLGIDARSNWLDGTTNVATSIYAAINKIITDLGIHNSVVNNGANKIGFLGTGTLLSQDVSDALDELDVNWGKLARANIWTIAQILNGMTGVSSAANDQLAGIQSTYVPTSRKLFFTLALSASQTGRLYYRTTSGAGNANANAGFEFTINAGWNGTNWVADLNTSPAMYLSIDSESASAGTPTITFQRKGTTTVAWADSAWDVSPLDLAALNPAVAAAVKPNTLYPLNVPKAWAIITTNNAGVATVVDGFGVASASVSGSNQLTVVLSNAMAFSTAWFCMGQCAGAPQVEPSPIDATHALLQFFTGAGASYALSTTATSIYFVAFGRQ